MAEINAALVNDLRRRTGLGLMECKALLKQTDGDLAKAETLAQEQGKLKAANRAGRAAKAGRVEVLISPDGKAGAMIELNSETDFVARNDDFRQMARELAAHALSLGTSELDAFLESTLPTQGKSVREALVELNARTGENVGLSHVVAFNGAGQVDYYIHHDGMKGALVQLSTQAPPAIAKDVAMHVVASPIKPIAVRREEVDAQSVEEQKRIYVAQIANQMADKPEQVREKIALGKLEAWFKETVLLEQEFIKDPAKKIRDVVAAAGDDATVKQFARFVVGEATS
jgi:elongation factor Ts